MHLGVCRSCGEKRFVSEEDERCFDCAIRPEIREDLEKRRKEERIMGNKKKNGEEAVKEKKVLALDFSDYPDLFVDLTERAREDFRTPELEALYLIKVALGQKKNS